MGNKEPSLNVLFAYAGTPIYDDHGEQICMLGRDVYEGDLLKVDDFVDWKIAKPSF